MNNNNTNNHNDTSMDVEDSEQSTHLKQTYRDLRENMHEEQSYYVDPKSNRIESALDTVEASFKIVRKTSDAVSGNQVLLQLTLLEKERIKNVHCEFRSFKNSEFMDKIKANFKIKSSSSQDQEEEEEAQDQFDEYVLTRENLIHFGKMVMPFFRVLPRPTFLIGSLGKEAPVIQRRQRKQREAVHDDESKRTQIKEIGKESLETETNKTVGEVERIYSILKKYFKRSKGVPICLFEFIINPDSFSRTIENIFYLSFLVKDGYAKISLSSDNLPVVEPNLENEKMLNDKKLNNQRDVNNIQSVISLTKLEWQELIKVYNIDRPLIPDPPEPVKH